MRYRQLSPTGDYTFGASQLNLLIDSPATVGQSVLTNLELFFGEWYLDTTVGVPYFQGILGKNSQALADSIIQDYVANIFGVTGIVNFESELSPSTRSYRITNLTVDTIFGVTIVPLSDFILTF